MPKTAFKVFVDTDGTVYGPGYTNPVPDEVAKEIRNPAIWEVPEGEDGEPVAERPAAQEEQAPSRGPRTPRKAGE